jgi:hypothetical protein
VEFCQAKFELKIQVLVYLDQIDPHGNEYKTFQSDTVQKPNQNECINNIQSYLYMFVCVRAALLDEK